MRLMTLAGIVVGLAGVALGQQAGGNSSETASTGVQSSAGTQASTQVNSNATASADAAVLLEAELTKGLDARKARPGDLVIAKCTKDVKGKGDFRVPKNAKLIGHVTGVQAKGKGQAQSSLAIAFDRAQMKDGREIPLQAVIQAIAAPADLADTMASANESESTTGAARSSGGVLSGVNSAVSSTTAASVAAATDLRTPGATDAALSSASNSSLNAASSGVIGLKGLQLDASAANNEHVSVIRSSSDTVRLESGTRLVLRLTVQ